MAEDTDSVPEREMKDFQFRQLKKIRVFDSPGDLPKERSNLLAVSNVYGLTFAGQDRTLKVLLTRDVMAVGHVDANPNEIVENVSAVTVMVNMSIHHLALSSDELSLSVCGVQDTKFRVDFYDVRTFFNKARQEKRPFTSFSPAVASNVVLQDLKWSPTDASCLALCLSDGSMMVLDVKDSVNVIADQPASAGVTCVCWSPKGKQVAAGKQDATVVQFTPTLQPKRVIKCPRFYDQEHPVRVLDMLWLSTYSFGVVYASADGSLETPPDLVMVSLPKKEDQGDEIHMNFNDLVYGSCTERQHHYFLCHIENWDLVLAASAASSEVSVIAKEPDKGNWELWILEDSSRAELPVAEDSEDTLPVGVAIDYTSQKEIQLSEEKKVPPAPILMVLSTDGVLCPFSLLNLNPGVKTLTQAESPLPVNGERAPSTKSLFDPAVSAAPSTFPSLSASFSKTPPPASLNFSAPPPAYPSSAALPPATTVPPPASSSTGFSFSLQPQASATTSVFSLNSTSSNFSFNAPKPSSETPAALSFSFGSALLKEASSSTPLRPTTASPVISGQKIPAEPTTPAVRMNLSNRFSAVETPASSMQPFTLTSTPKPSDSISQPTPVLNISRATAAPLRPAQSSAPPPAVPKTTSVPSSASAQSVSVKALEKHLQQKKDSDPVMAGILEEIEHFQKELDELKTRCRNFDFKVGSKDEMKELRKESENLHTFTLEIKDTTESVHGDISLLKTSLLEGFAGAEEAKAQSELTRDKDYLQLLYKKPLDPRREEQLKEIRRLYQYVKFAMEDVNDVLDLEWEKHLENRKKQRHMIVPEREALFAALANHLDIINQQKHRLEQLTNDLQKLKLYKRTSAWSFPSQTPSTPSQESLDRELENLKDALLKASLDVTPRAPVKSPSKMTPAKQTQLRNFLSKRQTPPVRSTAPANLSRSAFLFPQYPGELDEVSSTSSLPQFPETEDTLAVAEEEEEPGPIPIMIPSMPRHPAVVRTPSVQPGFMQSTQFSRLQTGTMPIVSSAPKINMDSADSTALATKTVKHGAPPTDRTTPTTIPAPQAAARAALNRHMTSQKPGTPLTESTLKVVPQVVNVQELRDEGPPVPLSTVISSSVPAPAAQVVQQVLATVEASKNSSQGGVKVPTPLAGAAQSTPGGFVFGGAVDSGVTSSSVTDRNSKTPSNFSFSAGPAFTSFTSTSQSQDNSNSQAKISALSGKFSFASSTGPKMSFGPAGSDESFSFTPKLSSPAQSSSSSTPPPALTETAKLQQVPKAQGGAGETLGCFSGLRVGQSDEGKEAPKTIGFSFASSSNGSAGFMFGSPQIKPVESGASSDLAGTKAEAPKPTTLQTLGLSSTFTLKPQEGTPLTTKPTLTVPSTTSFPPAATSFSSLLQAPLPETTSSPTQPEMSTVTSAVVASSVEESSAEPGLKPTASATPSTRSAPEEAASSPPVSVDTTITSSDNTSVQSSLSPEVTPPQPTTAGPTAVVTPVAKPPVEPISPPAPEVTAEVTTVPTPTPVSQEPSSPSSATSSVPSSDKPGSIFAPPSGGKDVPTLGPVNLTPAVSAAAPSTLTNPPVTSAQSAAPVPGFGQPPSSTTAFGTAGFGTSAPTGFGKSVFGQSTGAGFGQPAASGSASGFTFAPSAFGSTGSGFGQPDTTPAVTTTSSSGGGLFGTSTATSASSFSFGTSATSSASSTGTGLFGQSSAPAFGQPSSGFGQGSLFGSNTTTSSSSGFGFGQQPAFGSSTVSSSVFGQQTSGTSVFGQAQSGGGLFGSSAGNASSGSGFFSGLGGKPSEDAANKNPFGSTQTGAFGQSVPPGGSSSLFGSTAKDFSFNSSSFGEQKPSGAFSTGAGSVAAQGFGSFSTPTKQGGFGTAPVFGSPPTFGGSPAFGGPSNFGSAPSFNSPLGGSSSTSKVFGEGTAAANMGGFGFASPPSAPTFGSLANQNPAPPQPTSFGSMAQQPSGFGTQNTGFSSFGSSGGFGGFGNTNTNQSSPQTFNSWRS